MKIFRWIPLTLMAGALNFTAAYSLEGWVKDSLGMPVVGANVALLAKGVSSMTDDLGFFSISEPLAISGILAVEKSWSVQNGALFIDAGNSKKVRVELFDLMGHEILSQSGYAQLQIPLQNLPSRGVFIAKVQTSSSTGYFRFSPGLNGKGTWGETVESSNRLLFKMNTMDTLRVVASDYDTLNVPLETLDTTVHLVLKKIPSEEHFEFGWAKGNAPVPTRGCGHELTIPKTGSFEFQWSQGTRTIRVDIPDDYDNQKPYRLVFGMHCMGGWAGGVQQEGYYGLKPLDTEKTTIFIAPEGNGNMAPWGESDYTMFDELSNKLESELCIDSSRVFSTGFSYGSMFTNGLSRNHQDVLRGVAVYETAEINIYVPQHSGKSIAWMGVLGLQDNLCTPDLGRAARNTALRHNGPNFTDASGEQAEEYSGSGPHICYDYKTVDSRFPVRWCTQNGGHIWDHKDPGEQKSWVPAATWDFITQF